MTEIVIIYHLGSIGSPLNRISSWEVMSLSMLKRWVDAILAAASIKYSEASMHHIIHHIINHVKRHIIYIISYVISYNTLHHIIHHIIKQIIHHIIHINLSHMSSSDSYHNLSDEASDQCHYYRHEHNIYLIHSYMHIAWIHCGCSIIIIINIIIIIIINNNIISHHGSSLYLRF